MQTRSGPAHFAAAQAGAAASALAHVQHSKAHHVHCAKGFPYIARKSAARPVQASALLFTTRRIALASQLFARKSIDKLIRESEEPENALKKSLGPWSLTALGIGAVIGSGIFTVIGTAMAGQKFDAPSVSSTPLIHYLLTHTAMAGRPGAGCGSRSPHPARAG